MWLKHQAELLRARKFGQLDLDNLVDELNDMGRSRQRELKHRLMILVKHLLKCQIQPDHVSGSWLGKLNEQRGAIETLLEDIPSLNAAVPEYLLAGYGRAVKEAAAETKFPLSAFPLQLPFSQQQILDYQFIPGSPAVRRRIRRRAQKPA